MSGQVYPPRASIQRKTILLRSWHVSVDHGMQKIGEFLEAATQRTRTNLLSGNPLCGMRTADKIRTHGNERTQSKIRSSAVHVIRRALSSCRYRRSSEAATGRRKPDTRRQAAGSCPWRAVRIVGTGNGNDQHLREPSGRDLGKAFRDRCPPNVRYPCNGGCPSSTNGGRQATSETAGQAPEVRSWTSSASCARFNRHGVRSTPAAPRCRGGR